MFGLGTTEVIIIGGIVTLLFGAKKIPELAKGIGQGIKSFKGEMDPETKKDEKASS
jgi:sec-independent protein translocase protein TatA